MPRLPDVDSLGARPAPESRRSIASVRNAGAVANAVSDLGNTASRVGQQMLERDDRLNYAAAKSAILRADVNARLELQDDPDHETYEKRYQEKMAAARAATSRLIRSNTDRRLFEVDVQLDLDRGAGEVRQLARQKRVAADGATLIDGLETLQGTARDALDDATRDEAVKTAGDMISGAVAKGIVSPLDGSRMRREWGSGFAAGQISAAIDRGDPVAAKATFDKLKRHLSDEAFINLNRQLDGLVDDTVIRSTADTVMDTAPEGGEEVAAGMPVKGTVTSTIGAPRSGGRAHNGIDIAVPVGTNIAASGAGRVLRVWSDPTGGKSVLVDYGNGLTMGYAHLSTFAVKEGDVLAPGQSLGKSGQTGNATGPVLHWTARRNGKVIDPRNVKLGGGSKPETLEEAIARGRALLGPNAPRDQVNAVTAEIAARWNVREQAKRDAEESAVDAVMGALAKNGGDWNSLPASVKNSVPKKYWGSVISFGNVLRSGQDHETSPEEYVRLSEMAATKPKEFAAINPITYRNKFDRTDWERFVALRSEILGKPLSDAAKTQEGVSIGEVRSVTAPMLDMRGITTEGIPTKTSDDRKKRQEVARRQYEFEKSVLGDLAVWQRNNPGKKASPQDIQAIADRRLLLVTPEKGDPVPQFEARGGGKVNIPNADVVRITRIMSPILGRKPTPTEITQAYLREARGGL